MLRAVLHAEDTVVMENLASRNELAALAVLVLGVIAARLASLAVRALLNVLDRGSARLTTSDKSVVSPRLIDASQAIVFWLVVIFAVSFALQLMGIGGMAAMLNAVIGFIPQVLVAFTIVVAGHLLGLLASHLVAQLSDELSTSSVGPRLLHGAIVVVAVVMALQQIDVDITFVTQLLLVLVAIVGGGLMLAFALGARRHVANLLARTELSRFAIGERIVVDDIEGKIVDIHATGLDIATDDGIASVPAARLAEVAVVRKSAGGDDD